MTPDELRTRCAAFLIASPMNIAISEEPECLHNLESLCREMMGEGLERAGIRYAEWINGHEFLETPRFEDWCRQEAQRVKEGGA